MIYDLKFKGRMSNVSEHSFDPLNYDIRNFTCIPLQESYHLQQVLTEAVGDSEQVQIVEAQINILLEVSFKDIWNKFLAILKSKVLRRKDWEKGLRDKVTVEVYTIDMDKTNSREKLSELLDDKYLSLNIDLNKYINFKWKDNILKYRDLITKLFQEGFDGKTSVEKIQSELEGVHPEDLVVINLDNLSDNKNIENIEKVKTQAIQKIEQEGNDWASEVKRRCISGSTFDGKTFMDNMVNYSGHSLDIAEKLLDIHKDIGVCITNYEISMEKMKKSIENDSEMKNGQDKMKIISILHKTLQRILQILNANASFVLYLSKENAKIPEHCKNAARVINSIVRTQLGL